MLGLFYRSNLGLNESLFKRLDKPSVTSILNLQYRMNSEIMKLANSFTYQNALQCANEQINSATIDTQKLTAVNILFFIESHFTKRGKGA